ncbi:hypothetical protein A1O1_03749 [Capronia coronata CBS 617.96]|uniref:Transcriptional activator of proteases prtT n=1 Tax=Capronia coronata CBS 617.96 TaxID=1182541 RepID=W9YLT3_9EURO|nr:uncharacterized protein A1O1_03749 [Capronia coronata CBS 617.96]EXJ90645.1 hypothetical protein A1O1_03749 [Capronia coronata CBS 617.96]
MDSSREASLEADTPYDGEVEQRQPKRKRLNRPFTACTTCRRLKTKCEIASRDSCRRCAALRLRCDLPTLEQDALLSDSSSSLSIGARLERIEDSIQGISTLLRTLTSSAKYDDSRRRSGFSSIPDTNPTLQPLRPTSSYHNGVTRPVPLLKNLQLQLFGPKREFGDEVLAIGNVVSAGIIGASLANYLTKVFVQRLGKWIAVYSEADLPDDLEQNHPLLFSTACLLASPHVPNVSKDTIQQVDVLVRRLTASTVLKTPSLSHESIQALLLLSMFSPTIQTAMPMDSWMLSGTSVNHAVLSFNLANPTPEEEDEDTRLRQLRIWNVLCLTHIQFSVGNARPSVISQRFVDYCAGILDFQSSTMDDAALFAGVLLYSETEKMLNDSPIPSQKDGIPVYRELEDWHASWNHVLGTSSSRNSTLDFSYDFCYLLLYRTALKAQSDAAAVESAITRTASEILKRFLVVDFSTALEMPDFFFFIVIYATLNLCKFAVGHHLIASTQEYLTELAPNDEHIAHRFGAIIGELRRAAAKAGVSLSNSAENEQAFMAAQLPATEDGLTWQMLTTVDWTNLDLTHLEDMNFPMDGP